MALNQVIKPEERKKRSALENAALGLGLVSSLAGISETAGKLYKIAGTQAPGSTDPTVDYAKLRRKK